MPSTLRGSAMSVPDEKLDAEGRQMASGTALVGLTAPETRKIEPAGLDACDDQFCTRQLAAPAASAFCALAQNSAKIRRRAVAIVSGMEPVQILGLASRASTILC